MVTLYTLPFPPSANHQFINRGRFRVKSPQRRQFDSLVEQWAWMNKRACVEAQAFLKAHKFIAAKFEICAEPQFFLTKAGNPKRVDLDNRLKPFDILFDILGMDDCRIWSIEAVKKVTLEAPLNRHVNITLSNFSE